MKRIWALCVLLAVTAIICGVDSIGAATNTATYSAALKAVVNGQYEKAVELFTEAIRQAPEDYRLYNDRGVAYKRAGDLERAMADYAKALELKPDFTNALNNRGLVYLLKGEYANAVADFRKALECGGLEEKVHTNLGLALAAKGDHEAAVQSFKKALSSGPSDHKVFLFMAKSMEKMGSMDKALQMHRLALGFARTNEAATFIESEIGRLEAQRDLSRAPNANASRPRQPAEQPTTLARDRTTSPAGSSGTRVIVRAQPPSPVQPPAVKEPSPNGAVKEQASERKKITTLRDLEAASRGAGRSKLSPVAAEIFAQGLSFLDKSELNKALVRFEDTRNLERRRKNYHGIGWSDLEIARLLTRMGDHHKATAYFREALNVFSRIGATDEWILTALELSENQRVTGRMDEATDLRTKAFQRAASAGYHELVNDITAGPIKKDRTEAEKPSDIKALRPVPSAQSRDARSAAPARQVRQAPPSAMAVKEEKVDPPRTSGTQVNQWGNIGKGPITWAKTQPSKGEQPGSPPGGTSVDTRRNGAGDPPHPQGSVLSARGVDKGLPVKAPARRQSIEKELTELQKLKVANDEQGMVAVLERLAERYTARRDYRQALLALNAALGFRDKLRLFDGKGRSYLFRSLVFEKLGKSVAALEDLTHSLALGGYSAKEADTARERARKLVVAMEMEPKKIVDAYGALWNARKEGDGHEETRSLHRIAQLYDQAGKKREALDYYERSLASLLTDKALTHQALGSTELARKAFDEALDTLKELDYSRYVDLKRKGIKPNALSRQ